jgi:hypothetical protein
MSRRENDGGRGNYRHSGNQSAQPDQQRRWYNQKDARFNAQEQNRQFSPYSTDNRAALVAYQQVQMENQQYAHSTDRANSYNLEDLVGYIRNNPKVASSVHTHLTRSLQQKSSSHSGQLQHSSTPKRPHGLDDSGSNEHGTNKQARNGSSHEFDEPNGASVQPFLPLPNDQLQQPLPTRQSQEDEPSIQQQQIYAQQRRLAFQEVKRAVSSNLPCFLVEYDRSTTTQVAPSHMTAASKIEEHFKQQGINITFTLVSHVGNKLKLGVNNKEDYATLVSTDKWPKEINSIAVTVIKPKFTPDAFALVIRHVPSQYDDAFVKEEIERNLGSVNNIRQIRYAYERKTKDYRFNVADIREYNTVLNVGRMSIGNSMCVITTFKVGNRMTYCTRCWCIGHMRDRCSIQNTRCRVCLEDLITGQVHTCSNIPRCAQCDGSHHSLTSQCEKIMEYRADLKTEVNKALSTGKLHRIQPYEQSHQQQNQQYQMNENEFQFIQQSANFRPAPWMLAQTRQQTTTTSTDPSSDMNKTVLSMNEHLMEMKESSKRVEEKLNRLDAKLNQIALDTELHQNILDDFLATFIPMMNEFIYPLVMGNNATKEKKLRLEKLCGQMDKLRPRLLADYTDRRKRSSSPPPLLATASKQNNATTGNEGDIEHY